MTQDDRMETITDPAVIRACDEPDERGDFPCCADRAHKESLGGDSESGTYNRSNRPPAGPCTDERTIPAPVGAAVALDLEPEREAGELDAGGLRHLLGLRSEALARVAARAESAEAEVVTLRARLAAVEALTVDWPCSDDTCDGDCTGCAYASDLRAALAVTTGEGECSNCRQPLTAEPCSQPDGNGGKVTGHWVAGGPCEAPR